MTTVLFTILSALYDKGKRFTNHIPRFIFRLIIVAIISYIENGNFIINLLTNATIFYLIFDYLLNILENRKWNYIGNTSKIDLLWRNIKGGWKTQLIFKVTITLIMLYIQVK